MDASNPSTNQTKKRRTALYARVSTGQQSSGLDAQIRALRIFCEQNKIEDYELFADENQSGTKSSRPALDRMMKAIDNGEIEAVVVFAFSRFARSVTHMLKGLEIMRAKKTNFVSLSEKLDLNTSLGNVVFIIISAIAQLERDLIAERVRNGLAAAKARGKRIGRVRKRNDALIHSLLKAGLSFREVARIAKCSHGSVSASKKEYLSNLAREEKQKLEDSITKFDGVQALHAPSILIESTPEIENKINAAKNIGDQPNG